MNKTLTVLAMGAMLPLCAQSLNPRFGVKATIINPTGKQLKETARSGAQLGVFATQKLGLGHAVTANLGFGQFGEKITKTPKNKDCKETTITTVEGEGTDETQSPATQSKNTKGMNTINLGVDYTYHINKQQDGFYVLAGLDLEKTHYGDKTSIREVTKAAVDKTDDNNKVKAEFGKYSKAVKDDVKSNNHTKLGYKVGLGYDLDKNIGVETTYTMHKHGVYGLGLTYKF